MRLIRILAALLIVSTGSALAYNSLTVGLQAEAHQFFVGYNAHAVLPLATVPGGTGGRAFSARVDFSAGDVVYAGLAAVISGAGPGLQPFASLGGGAALWGGPLLPTVQGLLGVRVQLTGGLWATTQFQIRFTTRAGHLTPSLGVGLEYSF